MDSLADLDEFNSFLDTWMQDVPGAEQSMGQMPDMNPVGMMAGPFPSIPFPLPADLQLFPDHSTPSIQSSGSQANGHGMGAPEKSSSFGSGDGHQSGNGDAQAINPKKAKVLEKNRKAQKRFRDKQKMKMSEMQQQLETLQRNLEAVSLEKTSYVRQNEVLNKVLELRQSQINILTESARITNTAEELAEQQQAEQAAAAMSQKCVSGLSVEQIRGLSGKDAILKWRSCVQEMAAVIVQADMPDAPPDAVEALEAAAQKAFCFAQTLSIVNPNAIKVLIMSNQDTLNPDEERTKNAEFWTTVYDSLQLSEEQKDKIVLLARNLKSAIASSDAERQQLAKELHELLPSTCGTEGNLSSCIRSNELIARLRRNFHQEHEAWCGFTSCVLGTVLTTVQRSRFCVNAYPMFPNSLQLAKRVANCDSLCAAFDKPGTQLARGLLPAYK